MEGDLHAKLQHLGSQAERALVLARGEKDAIGAPAQVLADLKRSRNEIFQLLDEEDPAWEDPKRLTALSATARAIKTIVVEAQQLLEKKVGEAMPKFAPKEQRAPAVRRIPSTRRITCVHEAFDLLFDTVPGSCKDLSEGSQLDLTARLISVLRSLREEDFERFRSDVGQESEIYRMVYAVWSSLSSDVEEVASSDREAWFAFAERANQAWIKIPKQQLLESLCESVRHRQ